MNNDISNIIKTCNKCDLKGEGYAFPRIKNGNSKKIMFVGEAPGRMEAKYHISFIGRAGQELDSWIKYMNLDNYYITNVVKHRPVKDNKDRPPTADEVFSCHDFLTSEMLIYRPDFIILLGNSALRAFGIKESITKAVDLYIYNEKTNFLDIRLFALFHPSYVLRQLNMHNGFDLILKNYLDKINVYFH